MTRRDRRSGIGASEVAPIVLGQDRFGRTAVDVYSAKVLDPREFSTGAMSRGHFLESGVLAWYEHETGSTVGNRQAHCESPDHPWLFATPDGLLADRVVEAKTARFRDGWGEPGTDEIPLEYLIQVHSQMLCSGLRLADVPVLFGGLDFALFRVEFDAELAAMIIRDTGAFWSEHVIPKLPPQPRSGSDCELLYRRDNGAIVVASTEVEIACRALSHVKRDLATLEAQEQRLADTVKAAMGEAAHLVTPDGTKLATWKSNRDSTKFDTSRFQSEHPALFSQYQKVSPGARVFRLTLKETATDEHAEPSRITG